MGVMSSGRFKDYLIPKKKKDGEMSYDTSLLCVLLFAQSKFTSSTIVSTLHTQLHITLCTSLICAPSIIIDSTTYRHAITPRDQALQAAIKPP